MGIETERLKSILAACEGVTPGPWHEGDHWVFVSPSSGNPSHPLENVLSDGKPQANAAHIANCDPDTIRSILSELISLREAGWQDISTAPKDGTHVLVSPGRDGFVNLEEAHWKGDRNGWRAAADNWPIKHPTHWQPAPHPPSTESNSDA